MVLAHEYLHSLGIVNENAVRQMTFELCSWMLGNDHAATKMAKHFDKFGNAKVNKVTVKIFRKRLYKKRFKMRPDELGLARVRPLFGPPHRTAPQLFTRKTEAALV